MIQPYIRLSYGELLRLFRNKNKYTLKYLAEYLKVTPETIKNYEEDKTFPSYYKVKCLEALYNDEFRRLSEYILEKGDKEHTAQFRLRSLCLKFSGSLSDIKRFRYKKTV